ncbi:MAG: hypothetical protein Q8O41_06335, partial [Candidatus Methanoperedens sp.]|nr:hypothetical protein [Candidatus Methanoperedens sp.]
MILLASYLSDELNYILAFINPSPISAPINPAPPVTTHFMPVKLNYITLLKSSLLSRPFQFVLVNFNKLFQSMDKFG